MKEDLPWLREREWSHRYFQYEDCCLIHSNGSARFRRSPRAGAATPGVGWVSTLNARANHCLWMGLTGSILRLLLRWGLRGSWRAWDSGRGAPWFSGHLGVHMGKEYTHIGYQTKEMQHQNQSLCP